MLNQQESIKVLRKYFKKNEIATIENLMQLLKTKNSMSVYRRLLKLNYLSSFTDAGKYYTLKTIADFDSSGLWFINEIGFSCYGNLKKTVTHLIEQSETGKTYHELEKQLKINLNNSLHNALLSLVQSHKILRVALPDSRLYLYTSSSQIVSRKQISSRNELKSVLKENDYPDWIIIEILASIIRTNHEIRIEYAIIVSDLLSRKIIVTKTQVEQVLNKFNLKKTLG